MVVVNANLQTQYDRYLRSFKTYSALIKILKRDFNLGPKLSSLTMSVLLFAITTFLYEATSWNNGLARTPPMGLAYIESIAIDDHDKHKPAKIINKPICKQYRMGKLEHIRL